MPDFVSLTCPSCGGDLQISPDLDRFACSHCGNEHIVRRSGGVISIAPVVEGLLDVRESVDRTASELAIARINSELLSIDKQLSDISQAEAAHHSYGEIPVVLGLVVAPLAAIVLLVYIANFISSPDLGQVPRMIGLLIAATLGAGLIKFGQGKPSPELRKRRASVEQLRSSKLADLQRHIDIVGR